MRTVLSILALALALADLAACGGNPYGYAPEYVPLSDEEPYDEKGLPLSYEEVRRDPMSNQSRLIAWFGVVESVKPTGDRQQIAMQLVFHQERHLCTDQFDSSCRVTISEKEGGPFTAVVKLQPEHVAEGRDRVGPGSLMKIYGHVATDYDERGGPIVNVEYYRHWPHGTYVNTRRAGNMRR